MSKLSKLNVSNPKVWVVIGVGLAGVLILAEVHRRRLNAKNSVHEDFGAFVERFELLPSPQPPPPAARLPLSGLTFAISDKYVMILLLLLLHDSEVALIDLKIYWLSYILVQWSSIQLNV